MLKVTIMSNTTRDSEVVDPNNSTPRELLEQFDIDYNSCTVHLDGIPLGIGMMDQTFTDLGVSGDKTYLSAVVKQDNK